MATKEKCFICDGEIGACVHTKSMEDAGFFNPQQLRAAVKKDNTSHRRELKNQGEKRG